MNDYSEVTCHLQRDVVNLIQALNDKKWLEATRLANNMATDIKDVANFAYKETIK